MCAPFCFVKVIYTCLLACYHKGGLKINKRLHLKGRLRVTEQLGLEKNVLFFNTKYRLKCFTCNLTEGPPPQKVHQIEWWPSVHARLELVPFFKTKNLDSLL